MAQLRVEGISKSFDGEPVIRDISIELHKGELVSLLGISGGGKTTLFNIIAGLSAPDKGRVVMDGEDITGCPGHVSYMLQKDLLFPFCTIEDNVALPLIVKGQAAGGEVFCRIWPGRHPEKVSGPAFRGHAPTGGAFKDLSFFRQCGAVG